MNQTSSNTGQAIGGYGLNGREKDSYKVGETLKLVNYGFSLGKYEEGMLLNNGHQLIEVEVKSVQTAKVVLE